MDLQRGTTKFNDLRKRIKKNKKLIFIFNALNPVLMLLFIGVSFLTFYNNNVTEVSQNSSILFVISLVTLFVLIALFEFVSTKKKKENRVLSVKIVKLLNI